jgi:hypothetical protein
LPCLKFQQALLALKAKREALALLAMAVAKVHQEQPDLPELRAPLAQLVNKAPKVHAKHL